MITLGTLKTELSSFLVNLDIATRIPDWVHWTLKDILKADDFWWNKKTDNLTTVAGQSDYFLSHRVAGKQVTWMGDASVRGKEIEEKDLEEIYRFDSTPTESGDPVFRAYMGQYEVQAANPSGTSAAVSTSASDLAKIVVIRGKVSGIERYESISLNGTTSATPTSALTWDADSVISVSLSDVCMGAVTVTIGGTTVSSIPPGLQRIQCPRIKLWRVPASVLTLPYIFYQKAMKPILDGDIIDLPDEAFKALISGTMRFGHINNGDIDFKEDAQAEFEKELIDLKSWSHREANKIDRKDFAPHQKRFPWYMPRIVSGTVS